MWTLWLVSEAFQRLSLRNRSSLHSEAAPPISLDAVRGYRAATFFPRQFGGGGKKKSKKTCHSCAPFPVRHAKQRYARTRTISCENISLMSNVQGLLRQRESPQREAEQRRRLQSTCRSDRPPWNPLAAFESAWTVRIQPHRTQKVKEAGCEDQSQRQTVQWQGRWKDWAPRQEGPAPHCVGDEVRKRRSSKVGMYIYAHHWLSGSTLSGNYRNIPVHFDPDSPLMHIASRREFWPPVTFST